LKKELRKENILKVVSIGFEESEKTDDEKVEIIEKYLSGILKESKPEKKILEDIQNVRKAIVNLQNLNPAIITIYKSRICGAVKILSEKCAFDEKLIEISDLAQKFCESWEDSIKKIFFFQFEKKEIPNTSNDHIISSKAMISNVVFLKKNEKMEEEIGEEERKKEKGINIAKYENDIPKDKIKLYRKIIQEFNFLILNV